MSTIVDYAKSMLNTFDELPFSRVDSLVLSWLSYTKIPDCDRFAMTRTWDGMRLADLFCAEYFDDLMGGMWDISSSMELLTAMVASPRYRDIQVCAYREQYDAKKEKQFSAMTLRLTPDLSYIAFRGTDASLVGWKEDLNLAFTCPVPAQKSAARYVNEASKYIPGEFMTGGHSKGGNLAIYAAASCKPAVRKRLAKAFSHDGPGFMEQFFASAAFKAIEDRVDKTIPQSSLVGLLLENHEDFSIIKSQGQGVMQHNPFTWLVEDGAFLPVEKLSASAAFTDHALHTWLAKTDIAKRRELIDTLYDVLVESVMKRKSEIITTEEWVGGLVKNFRTISQAVKSMDPDTSKFVMKTVRSLIATVVSSIPEVFKEGLDDVLDEAREDIEQCGETIKQDIEEFTEELAEKIEPEPGPVSLDPV
ncbi:MAG: DUF2974 domain-containing protein [Coriobacteriales bacterium]|nr:DUF2974 domain-containing protein [Coriobacteriales bacterium]